MRSRLLSVGIAALAGSPSFAIAASPDDQKSLHSIIVTGERTARDLNETVASVSVITHDDLTSVPDLDRLDQLLDTTPNVVLGSGGQGPTIRGVDTTGALRDLQAFLGGTRPRTTLIVDGRAISYNEFVFGAQPLWDVDQIEFYRSPQSTTQGRNSIAGAIFVKTRQPEHEWAGKGRVIVGNYATQHISAMLTGPIVQDELAIRLTGDSRHSRTTSELVSPIVGVDPNRDKYDTLRFKFLATPSALPGMSIDGSYQHTEAQAPQIVGIRAPLKERRDPFATYGVFRTNSDAVTLLPKIQFGPKTMLSATFSAGWTEARRFAPSGLGEANNLIDDQSVEILIHHSARRFSLVGGVSTVQSNLDQAIDLSTLGFGAGSFRDRQRSFGVFGEATFIPISDIAITAGLRFQADRQVRKGGLESAAGRLGIDYEGRFSSFSPKLSVVYDPDSDTTFGLLIQRAANPGGATLSPATGRLDTFGEEHLWNYEIFVGRESSASDIRYSANLFYYDMRDAQRSVLRQVDTPGGTFYFQEIGNVPRSWSKGAEVQMAWVPSRHLELSVAVGLLDTRITRTPTDRDPLMGKQFQRSPNLTGAASVRWTPSEELLLSLAYSRRSGYFSDDANTDELRIDAAESLDGRIEWERGPVRFFGYMRNVFNRLNLSYLFDNGQLATAADPRQFGVGAEIAF